MIKQYNVPAAQMKGFPVYLFRLCYYSSINIFSVDSIFFLPNNTQSSYVNCDVLPRFHSLRTIEYISVWAELPKMTETIFCEYLFQVYFEFLVRLRSGLRTILQPATRGRSGRFGDLSGVLAFLHNLRSGLMSRRQALISAVNSDID